MATGALGDVEVLSLYDAIPLSRYDLLFYVSALCRSQEINWSRYGCDSLPIFLSDCKRGQVFHVPLLCEKRTSKTGSSVIADALEHEVRWIQETQFASISRCNSERLEFGGTLDSGGGPKVVIFERSVLGGLELLFGREAGCTRDVGAPISELQKEWGLLPDL